MNKMEAVRAWCASRVGCPYIYGGTGQPCTPAYRRARAAQYPDYESKIRKNCPQLSGTASACAGCPWFDQEAGQGKRAYDCAQLSRRAMEQVGIPMVSGANSQWERTRWAGRGDISSLPQDQAALVFRRDGDRMGHVGVYQGDGWVIHAKGHDWGVVRERLNDAGFTHWGQPEGLLDEGPFHPVLRPGDSGAEVTLLQALLCKAGHTVAQDGAFGPKTEAAVKAFQRASGLTADGVAGPKTWAALDGTTSGDAIQPPDTGASGDKVSVDASHWAAVRDAAARICQIIQEYENVE